MARKILVITIPILIVLVAGIYLAFHFIFNSNNGEEIPNAPPVERHEFQGIEYEIVSVGGPVYDVVTGELTKEQAEALAGKIIEDILTKNPETREITLFFYFDIISAGSGEYDVAKITWTTDGGMATVMAGE